LKTQIEAKPIHFTIGKQHKLSKPAMVSKLYNDEKP